MNWAMKQATGDPRAQCLLYVVADAASPEGIAWPSADWLAGKSQQSRATVYRRLKQMQGMGLLILFPRYIDNDGKIWTNAASGRRQTSPEIRLQFDALVTENIIPEHGEAEDSSDTPVSASDTPIATQQQPPSHCGDSKNPNLNQERPIQPSQGKALDQDSEKRFQEFKSSYPDGIVDPEAAKREFAALSEPDQIACVAAVPVYASRCRKRREKSLKAHLFVRKRSWEGLLASPTDAAAPQLYEPKSPAAKALRTLGAMARYTPLTMADGRLSHRGEITPRLLAMAEIDAETKFAIYKMGSPNFRAWRNFIIEVFKGCNLPDRMELSVPWPWPPKADGSIYSGSDPPPLVPGTLATDEDLAEMDITARG